MSIIAESSVSLTSTKEMSDEIKATNQYFWYEESGTDAGAHITEVPQATFKVSATGGNLLARTNGIAVRDGLTDLATFGSAGAVIGKTDEQHVEIDADSFEFIDENGDTLGYISTQDGTAQTYTQLIETNVTTAGDDIFFDSYVHPAEGTTVTVNYASGTDSYSFTFNYGTDASGSSTYLSWTYTASNGYVHLVPTRTIAVVSMVYGIEAPKWVNAKFGRNFDYSDSGVGEEASHGAMKVNGFFQATGAGANPSGGIGFTGCEGHFFANKRDLFEQKVLWSGAYYMTANHTATLSDLVSNQPHGILLVWSMYSGGAVDNGWQFQFIPKWYILFSDGYLEGSYVNSVFYANPQTGNIVCKKTLAVYDDRITGHANNGGSGTGYNNSFLVLRYVLGV